jgi:hypothetical protein
MPVVAASGRDYSRCVHAFNERCLIVKKNPSPEEP